MPHLTYSASDLSNFLACNHLALLDRAARLGGPKPPVFDDPGLELLWERGLRHEAAYEEALRGQGLTVLRIEDPGRDVPYADRWNRLTGRTLEAMRSGVDVIAQGGLWDGTWVGRPDFLRRVDDTNAPLGWRYEARALEEPPYAPEPAAHCDVCAWSVRCDAERRDVDHLTLVAGIHRSHRHMLAERGISTLEALGRAETSVVTEGLPTSQIPTYQRVHNQARVQLRGRIENRPIHELLEVVEGEGLAALPAPSRGDLFFDIEGNPYAADYGLEYLFGVADAEGNYVGKWGLDRAGEKRAFEEFTDLVIARLQAYPDMHVYHFAPYEPTALKRLMGMHGTREAEVDRLLRGGVLVDLYRVVRQALRASVESYSIKKLEPFYGFARQVELRAASTALSLFDAWLELCPDEEAPRDILAQVEGYNRDDCLSTLRLRDWLERLRAERETTTGTPIPRPQPVGGEPPDNLAKRLEEVAVRMDALLAGVPEDPQERTPEEQGRWLLAQLLEFHRRENKASWWEYFRCLELPAAERLEDRAVLADLAYVGVVGTEKKSDIHRYRFPPQDHGVRGAARDADTEKSAGSFVAIDNAAGHIDLKRGPNSKVPHPRALIPYDMIPDEVLRASLLRLADEVIAHGLTGRGSAAVDLIMRNPPRLASDAVLMRDGETPLDAALRLVDEMDGTVLPIQGPPGAGKTYTAAAMIVRALELGRRVGVTANSHKVISNLLREACRAAQRAGVRLAGIQKCSAEEWCSEKVVEATDSNARVAEALRSGEANLAAGTAWLWSRDDMAGSVDVLFVDEAGQFSLANTLAVASAGRNLVLLGDPRQLDQPLQGAHPPGAEASALEHLFGGEVTVPPDRGLFLEKTWRLHPEICAFTSEIFLCGATGASPGIGQTAADRNAPARGERSAARAGSACRQPERVSRGSGCCCRTRRLACRRLFLGR